MTHVVGAEQTARRRPRAGVVVAVALTVAVAGWWMWPSLAGHDERLDVLVAGDAFLTASERSIELRIRESGRSLDWTAVSSGWCTDPDALARIVEQRSPGRVVLSFATGERCAADLSSRLDPDRVVAVVQPGAGPDAAALRDAGYAVVDPEPLVGSADDRRMPCEWWESCDNDGQIAVRDDFGELTEAGRERVARMIVAGL